MRRLTRSAYRQACIGETGRALCGRETFTLVNGEPLCINHRGPTVTCRQHHGAVLEDDTQIVQRKVGGSYKRAPRWQGCRICEDCARRLAAHTQRGHMSVDRWSITGLRLYVERLERVSPA